MTILALDASGPTCSVAVMRDDRLLYEATSDTGLNHSMVLLPMAENALSACGLSMRGVDRLATAVGPGSFTGVRIGVATVKGLALPYDTPCVGVDALRAYAAGVSFEGIVCPIRDARAGQVYGAAFLGGERLLDDVIERLEAYADRLPKAGDLMFIGDGVPAFRAALSERFGRRARFAPPHLNGRKAGAVAYLARLAEAVPGDDLSPLYLRAPQAERERLKREQADG